MSYAETFSRKTRSPLGFCIIARFMLPIQYRNVGQRCIEGILLIDFRSCDKTISQQ